ncbi:MAG: hypothetical protein HY347_01395 [candidate division NC10 bacterium]|nr:hypothetical protein [candidate division NC10 bacterium]
MSRERKRKIIHSLDEIPATFPSEDAEREYWETHEFSDELYDAQEIQRLTVEHRALIQKLMAGTAGVRRHRP